MSLYHSAYCDACGELLTDGAVVSVLLPVQVTKVDKDEDRVRLKLSETAIANRALSIYCHKCIDLEEYVEINKEAQPEADSKTIHSSQSEKSKG